MPSGRRRRRRCFASARSPTPSRTPARTPPTRRARWNGRGSRRGWCLGPRRTSRSPSPRTSRWPRQSCVPGERNDEAPTLSSIAARRGGVHALRAADRALRMKPRGPTWRVGEGWDSHALVTGRKLILGGVEIAHTHGLAGHSDADALCHAITDALFGAAALGDIGHHFPDTDMQYQGADSLALLAEATRRVRAAGWQVGNVDATVIAQAPKLAPHIAAMRQRLAGALGVAIDQVSVKAKTAEGMGPVGRGEAMEARAVCLLFR